MFAVHLKKVAFISGFIIAMRNWGKSFDGSAM